jgi:hypothetical protein
LLIEDGEFGIGLAYFRARRKARRKTEIADPHAQPLRGHEGEFEIARRENVGLADEGKLDARGQNSDDGARDAVEGDGCAEDSGVAPESRTPNAIAQ